jgi:hypothetical protein
MGNQRCWLDPFNDCVVLEAHWSKVRQHILAILRVSPAGFPNCVGDAAGVFSVKQAAEPMSFDEILVGHDASHESNGPSFGYVARFSVLVDYARVHLELVDSELRGQESLHKRTRNKVFRTSSSTSGSTFWVHDDFWDPVVLAR